MNTLATLKLNVQVSNTTLRQVQGKLVLVAKQGPPGAPGSSGGAVYTHTQSSAATTWTINHNLGFKPSVEILDTGGNEMIAQVLHVSVNQTQILFNTAKAGTARLT